MLTFRYSQWDGSQQVFDPDQDDLMEALAEDLMEHGDVNRALRDMMRRGMQMPDGQRLDGLRDLMDRLRRQRQEQLQRFNMEHTMEDLKEKLQDILQTEREGMDRRVQETEERVGEPGQDPMKDQLLENLRRQVERNKETLDSLPESLGGAVRELNDYEFMDPEAARKFQELMDELRGQMANNMMQNMRQNLENMTPGDMSAMRQMLRDLNDMLETGGEPNFQEFMDKYGSMFGQDPPQNLQELLEHMRRQMAQMDSLLNSMSADQRQELMDLMDSLMDDDMARELSKLASLMSQFLPPDDLGQRYPFMGDDPLDLQQAMQLMGELQDMDQLEKQLQEVGRRGNLDDLDLDEIERLLGEEARRNLEQLKDMARMLEEAGFIRRNGDRMELTPRGIRKIGQKALKEVFANLKKDRLANHELYEAGLQGDISGRDAAAPVRRPVRHLAAKDAEQRHHPQRAGHAGEGPPQRLRAGGAGGGDAGRDVRAARPEPLDGALGELVVGKEGGAGAHRAGAQQVPAGRHLPHRLLGLRTAHQGGGPAGDIVERVGVGHQHAARVDDVPQAAEQPQGRDATGHHDHGRRTHGAHGGGLRGVQLPSQLPHDAGNAQGGAAVHAGGRDHQYLHAGVQPIPAGLRGQTDAHQQGASLLHEPLPPGRVRACRLHQQPAEAGVGVGAAFREAQDERTPLPCPSGYRLSPV